jgi:hypothetical protein
LTLARSVTGRIALAAALLAIAGIGAGALPLPGTAPTPLNGRSVQADGGSTRHAVYVLRSTASGEDPASAWAQLRAAVDFVRAADGALREAVALHEVAAGLVEALQAAPPADASSGASRATRSPAEPQQLNVALAQLALADALVASASRQLGVAQAMFDLARQDVSRFPLLEDPDESSTDDVPPAPPDLHNAGAAPRRVRNGIWM